jgi:hypothetical protein
MDMARRRALAEMLLLLLTAAALHAESVAPTAITLRPTVQVSAATVLLSDVAQVTPAEAAQALAGAELGPAPTPGTARTFTAGYVKVRLRRAGVNLRATVFQGEQCMVSRAAGSSAQAPVSTMSGSEAAAGAMSPDVRIGGKVTLVVRLGGLQITTEAEALNACVVGQEALFRVRDTRATVKARLLDHETAEVIR